MFTLLPAVTIAVAVASEQADTVFTSRRAGTVAIAVALVGAHPSAAVACFAASSVAGTIAFVTAFSADARATRRAEHERQE